MAVDRRYLDAIFAQSADEGFHLVGCDHEVAGDRRLSISGWLKVDHGGDSHGGWNRRTALGDRVLARNGELIDAAVDLPLSADGLVQGQRVEVDLCHLRRRRRRRTKWCLALAKRGAMAVAMVTGSPYP